MRILYGALWGLMILSVMRTTIMVRRRDTSEFASVDGSASLAVLIVALLLGLAMINPRTRRVLMDMRRSSAMVLLIYFCIGLLSALWSALPAFSIFRAAEVIAIFITAYILMSRHTNFLEAERTVLRVLLAVTVLSFLQRAINVGISIEGLHTNVYTVTAGLGVLYCFGESFGTDKARKKMLRRKALMFLFFLGIGTSVGSNIGVVMGLMVMMMMLGFGRVIILPVLSLLLLVAFLSGAMTDLLTSTVFSGRSIEDLSNLTGRNVLWAAYLDGFAQRPFTGYGFAVGARLDTFGVRATTNTHNGFLEAILGMGLMGIFVLLYYVYALIRESLFARRMRVPGAIGMAGGIAMLMVNNNSKSIIGGAYDPTHVGVFVMLAFFHYCVYRQAQVRRQMQDRAPVVDPRMAAQT